MSGIPKGGTAERIIPTIAAEESCKGVSLRGIPFFFLLLPGRLAVSRL